MGLSAGGMVDDPILLDQARAIAGGHLPHFLLRATTTATRQITIERSRIEHADIGYSSSADDISFAYTASPKVLFFFGYALIDGQCIFSAQEAQEVVGRGHHLQGCNGCYLALIAFEHTLRICTDFTGSTPLFTWIAGDDIIVSTSFKLLAQRLRDEGVDLDLDTSICKHFLVRKTPNDQLFSARTLVSDIRFVPWGHHILIRFDTGSIMEVPNTIPESKIFKDYKSAVLGAASEILTFMQLAAKIGDVAEIPLTGGQDSRVLYAAARYLGPEQFNIYPVQKPQDNAVARRLMALPATGATPTEATVWGKTPLSPEVAIERWERTNLGFYSFLEISQTLHTNTDALKIELRGGGGGVMRSFYKEADVRHLFDKVDEQAIGSTPITNKLGVGQLFYLAYRNRIHFGRTFAEFERITWRFDPMNTWQMVNAANISPAGSADYGQFYLDLILLFYPPASLEIFDDKKKTFPKKAFMESEFFCNRHEIPSPDLQVGDVDQFVRAFRAEPSSRVWLPGREFMQRVSGMIADATLGSFPGRKDNVETVMERFLDQPAGIFFPEFGREASKYYAVARLSQMGVRGRLDVD